MASISRSVHQEHIELDQLDDSHGASHDKHACECACVTEPVPLSPDQLRAKIMEVQRRDDLDQSERSILIQQLMTAGYKGNKRAAPDTDADQSSPTYHDADAQVLGCKHYKRGCKIKAPCCGKLYTCRFCHDEAEDHQIDRWLIKEMMCMSCSVVQPTADVCSNEQCGRDMARYFCKTCNFFDDDEQKDIYHCPHCNICRIGKGLDIDYFHCMRCNACMHTSLRDHKCVERSLESNCPICSDFMFTSTTPVMFLNCGHCMHVNCYEEYIKVNYTCPICSKSLGDMSVYFARLDEWLKQEVMPSEFSNMKAKIVCADCECRSVAPYHFSYHKCGPCGSYNTKVMSTYRSEDEEEVGEEEEMTLSESSPSLEDASSDGAGAGAGDDVLSS